MQFLCFFCHKKMLQAPCDLKLFVHIWGKNCETFLDITSGFHGRREPTTPYEMTGPNVPGRANVPRPLPVPTNSSWQNSQTESSGQGLLQHQQQSNLSAASSSSRPQVQETSTESTLFSPMRTNLMGESSVNWQTTEYKIVQELCKIFPHLDNIELHLKVNHHFDKRLTKVKSSSEKDIFQYISVCQTSPV